MCVREREREREREGGESESPRHTTAGNREELSRRGDPERRDADRQLFEMRESPLPPSAQETGSHRIPRDGRAGLLVSDATIAIRSTQTEPSDATRSDQNHQKQSDHHQKQSDHHQNHRTIRSNQKQSEAIRSIINTQTPRMRSGKACRMRGAANMWELGVGSVVHVNSTEGGVIPLRTWRRNQSRPDCTASGSTPWSA